MRKPSGNNRGQRETFQQRLQRNNKKLMNMSKEIKMFKEINKKMIRNDQCLLPPMLENSN